MELWLKHYLSLFFDFEHFGNLNWLAIPLFFYFVATIKKRKRWEIAIVFVLFLSCLFLLGTAKGRSNPRYIFTLYPFTLAVIFLYGWELIKKKRHSLQIGILIICGIAVLFNFYQHKETYSYFWKHRVTPKNLNLAYERIDFINKTEDINSNNLVLVCCHRYLFYYHTDKKGIYHRDPRLKTFYRQKNKEAAFDMLKNQLKVKYIFRNWNFRPTGFLSDIIANDCDLLIEDGSGYLYKIRENNNKEEGSK